MTKTKTKRKVETFWHWFLDSCQNKKKLTKKQRATLSGMAGLGSAILIVLVFTKAHRETAIQLDQSEARTEAIQAMLDSQDFGYAIMDQEGKIIEWNPALERLTHYTQKEVQEKGMSVLMPPDMYVKHTQAVNKMFGKDYIEGSKTVINCTIEPHNGESEKIPVEITIRAIQSRKGKRFATAHVDLQSNVKRVNVPN